TGVVRQPTVSGSFAASVLLGREHRSLNDLDVVTPYFNDQGFPELHYHLGGHEVIGRLRSVDVLPGYDHVRLLDVEIASRGSISQVLVDVDCQSPPHPAVVATGLGA